jgi:hypothetical protein
MPAATYQDLQRYIKANNPYSTSVEFPDTLGPDGGEGVLIADANPADPWSLRWDFREPAAGSVGTFEFGKLDVINYPIVRAIFVPYRYNWTQGSQAGDPPRLMANIVIGFTPTSEKDAPVRPFVNTPSAPATNGGYSALGSLIEAAQPLHPETILESQVGAGGALSDIVTAVSWLAPNSAAGGNGIQKSNARMTQAERQQCLYWDGPRRLTIPFGPAATAQDNYPVFSYQITKAFRIGYSYTRNTKNFKGYVLVGDNGGGDAG